MKNKILIGTIIGLSLLTACSLHSPKVYPALELPYEIVNEDVEAIKEQGYKDYRDYQELKKITVRELTDEENEYFLKKMEFNTLNDLNSEYSAVEFYFGDTKYIHQNKKIYRRIDEEVSYFVYDDEIIKDDFYQIPVYESNESLLKKESTEEKRIAYGEFLNDFKIVTLIKKDRVKKGLQFKTIINNEIVYLDIK